VIALAVQIGLTDEQHQQAGAIFRAYERAAKPLGEELVEREPTLGQQFARGEITPEALAAATTAIGELQGRPRSVHLTARISKPVLC
jgi:hypothetical protein